MFVTISPKLQAGTCGDSGIAGDESYIAVGVVIVKTTKASLAVTAALVVRPRTTSFKCIGERGHRKAVVLPSARTLPVPAVLGL